MSDNPVKANDPMAPPMYMALAQLRIGEATLRWQRAQMFIALNTAALTVGLPVIIRLDVQLDVQGPWRALMATVLGIFGVVMSYCWRGLTLRAREWMEFWNEQLEAMEQTHNPQLKVFTSDKFKRIHGHGWSYDQILNFLSIAFLIIWCIVLLAATNVVLYQLQKGGSL